MDCPNGMKGMCSISKKDPPRGNFPCAKGFGALRVPVAMMAYGHMKGDAKGAGGVQNFRKILINDNKV